MSTDQTLVGKSNLTSRLIFFRQVPLFAELTESELAELVKDFARREFRQGESIFAQGDPGQVLYLIESGQVRIFVHGSEGHERPVVFYGSGDIFGELAVIDGLPRSASAEATENTVVYTLSRDLFREHMRRAPQLALNFMKALSVRVRHTTDQVGNLALLDVPSRLARKLLELAQNHGQVEAEGVRINLTLTQSELASMIGATRESINKALGNFKRQSLIRMEQGHIIIVDPDSLREISS
ncbi:MAG TPA: Crp/Fnr family transcriptional regulator [Anaerolineales bacterium]|nr:Crp/Fnr family transcriptional regulator [Anaerolineales bacterium]